MKNILVMVAEPLVDANSEYDAPAPRWVFPDSREWSEAVDDTGEVDTHSRNWQRRVKQWLCDEKDLQAVVNQLTKWHGDVEIRTYKLDTVYYRTVGALESKAVTKDGVLPF